MGINRIMSRQEDPDGRAGHNERMMMPEHTSGPKKQKYFKKTRGVNRWIAHLDNQVEEQNGQVE